MGDGWLFNIFKEYKHIHTFINMYIHTQERKEVMKQNVIVDNIGCQNNFIKS